MIARITRILALLNLFPTLIDIARLLGVGEPDNNPISVFGQSDFIYLACFALARLFAAVGMWIYATWGTALLIITSLFEILVTVMGWADLELNLFSWLLRIGLLFGAVAVLALVWREEHKAVHH